MAIADGFGDLDQRLVGADDQFLGAGQPQLAQMLAGRGLPRLAMHGAQRAFGHAEQRRDIRQRAHPMQILSGLPPGGGEASVRRRAGSRFHWREAVEQRQQQALAPRQILGAILPCQLHGELQHILQVQRFAGARQQPARLAAIAGKLEMTDRGGGEGAGRRSPEQRAWQNEHTGRRDQFERGVVLGEAQPRAALVDPEQIVMQPSHGSDRHPPVDAPEAVIAERDTLLLCASRHGENKPRSVSCDRNS